LNPDELLTADRNFYSFTAWGLAYRGGAALLWRAPTGLGLPVVRVLADGTFLALLVKPAVRDARRAGLLADAPANAMRYGVRVDLPPDVGIIPLW
jgi:hypothetical protein